jgi:hypothetical protein
MFSQSVLSSSGSAFPGPATVHPSWGMANPDVDRSAPPPPRKKRSAKKKVTKKPAKKR